MKYLLALSLTVFALLPIPPLPRAIAPQVHAAEANGCEVLGTVGNVIVSRCIDDETGNIVYANSAGFMQVAP